MPTITASTNIGATTYTSGEDFIISNGAFVKIDAQDPADLAKLATLPGTFQCQASGGLELYNTSTTTPLVVTLSSASKDFRFEKNAIGFGRGALIPIGTGTGATQTFDLSASPLNTIPYPSHVTIKVGNKYTPWNVAPIAGTTVTWSTSEIGSGYTGNVLFWNATTRQLSSGNGTNGNFIPLGAEVLIPNIYLYSNSTSATPSSRTLIDLSPTGTLDFECVGFCDRVHFSNSTFKSVRLIHCGTAGEFNLNSSNGDVELDDISVNPETTQTTILQAFQINGILGFTKIGSIATLIGGPVAGGGRNTLAKLYGLTSSDGTPKISNCNFKRRTGRTAGTDESLLLQTFPENTVFEDLVAGGGRVEMTNIADATFINFRHADEIGTSVQTPISVDAIVTTNCQRLKFVGGGEAGIGGIRNSILNADDQSNFIEFFNFDYNTNGNGIGLFSGNGVDVNFYNCTIRNLRTGALVSDPPTSFLASRVNFYNCRATGAGTVGAEAIQAGEYQLIPCQRSVFATVFTGGTQYAYTNAIDLGLSPTQGNIIVGPFGAYSGLVLTGTAQLDQAGGAEIPTSGDVMEVESRYAIKGVTAGNASPGLLYTYIEGGITSTDTSTAPSGLTIEFRLRTPSGTYGSYQAYTSVNFTSAISALSGFDSDEGFFMQTKFTATSTDATRVFYQVCFPTLVDNTYVAPDASITFLGPQPTDIIKMFLDEGGGPTSDTLLNTFTGGGVHRFSASAYFLQDVYFVRYTSANETIMSTRSNPQPLILGSNGEVAMFAGAEVQTAQSSDIGVIRAIVEQYLDATISSRSTLPQIEASTILAKEASVKTSIALSA